MSPARTVAHKLSHNLAESNVWSLSTPTSCPKNSQLWCSGCSGTHPGKFWKSPQRNISQTPWTLDPGFSPSPGDYIFSLYVIRFLLLQLIFIIFGVHLLFPSVFPKRVICRTTYSLVKNRNKIPPRAFSSGNWTTLFPSVFPHMPYAPGPWPAWWSFTGFAPVFQHLSLPGQPQTGHFSVLVKL